MQFAHCYWFPSTLKGSLNVFAPLIFSPNTNSIAVTHGARCRSVVRAFAHGATGRRIDPSWWTHWAISRFSQCSTNDRDMCYPVCGMVHIKEPLLLIGNSSPFSGGSEFPLSLSEWPFIIRSTPYNRKENVSLNKKCPSFRYNILHSDQRILLQEAKFQPTRSLHHTKPMFINQLRTFKKFLCNLEMNSNRMDEESSVGIPLVPKCKFQSPRIDGVLGLPDLVRSLTTP